MKIATLMVTQDRRLRKANKNTFIEWISSGNQSWFALRRLFAFNQYFKGKVGLVLESGYSVPLNPYNDYTEEEMVYLTDLNARADQASTIAEADAQREARQNIIAKTIAFSIACFVMIVVVLATLVTAKTLGVI